MADQGFKRSHQSSGISDVTSTRQPSSNQDQESPSSKNMFGRTGQTCDITNTTYVADPTVTHTYCTSSLSGVRLAAPGLSHLGSQDHGRKVIVKVPSAGTPNTTASTQPLGLRNPSLSVSSTDISLDVDFSCLVAAADDDDTVFGSVPEDTSTVSSRPVTPVLPCVTETYSVPVSIESRVRDASASIQSWSNLPLNYQGDTEQPSQRDTSRSLRMLGDSALWHHSADDTATQSTVSPAGWTHTQTSYTTVVSSGDPDTETRDNMKVSKTIQSDAARLDAQWAEVMAWSDSADNKATQSTAPPTGRTHTQTSYTTGVSSANADIETGNGPCGTTYLSTWKPVDRAVVVNRFEVQEQNVPNRSGRDVRSNPNTVSHSMGKIAVAGDSLLNFETSPSQYLTPTATETTTVSTHSDVAQRFQFFKKFVPDMAKEKHDNDNYSKHLNKLISLYNSTANKTSASPRKGSTHAAIKGKRQPITKPTDVQQTKSISSSTKSEKASKNSDVAQRFELFKKSLPPHTAKRQPSTERYVSQINKLIPLYASAVSKQNDPPIEVANTSKPADLPTQVVTTSKPTYQPIQVVNASKPTYQPTQVVYNSKPSNPPNQVVTTSKPSNLPIQVVYTSNLTLLPIQVVNTSTPTYQPVQVVYTSTPGNPPNQVVYTSKPSDPPTQGVNTSRITSRSATKGKHQPAVPPSGLGPLNASSSVQNKEAVTAENKISGVKNRKRRITTRRTRQPPKSPSASKEKGKSKLNATPQRPHSNPKQPPETMSLPILEFLLRSQQNPQISRTQPPQGGSVYSTMSNPVTSAGQVPNAPTPYTYEPTRNANFDQLLVPTIPTLRKVTIVDSFLNCFGQVTELAPTAITNVSSGTDMGMRLATTENERAVSSVVHSLQAPSGVDRSCRELHGFRSQGQGPPSSPGIAEASSQESASPPKTTKVKRSRKSTATDGDVSPVKISRPRDTEPSQPVFTLSLSGHAVAGTSGSVRDAAGVDSEVVAQNTDVDQNASHSDQHDVPPPPSNTVSTIEKRTSGSATHQVRKTAKKE